MKTILDNDTLRKPRQSFLRWYRCTPDGESLQTCEASFIYTILKGTYNERILQVESLSPERCITHEINTRSIFFNLGQANSAGNLIQVHGEMQALPFENDSMDKVILPHVVEFETGPRAVLEECVRILKPEGELIILAFNPWHLKAMKLMLTYADDRSENTTTSRTLLERWLHRLGCETSLIAGFQLGPPAKLVNTQTWLGRLRAGFSAVYAIKAQKQRLNPISLVPAVEARFPTILTGCMPEISLIRKR